MTTGWKWFFTLKLCCCSFDPFSDCLVRCNCLSGHQVALLSQTVSPNRKLKDQPLQRLKAESSSVYILSHGGGCVDHPAEYTLELSTNTAALRSVHSIFCPASWLTGHPFGWINWVEFRRNLTGPQLLTAFPMMLKSLAKAERNDPLTVRDVPLRVMTGQHGRQLT